MTYPLKFRQHVLAFKKKEALTYAETADLFSHDMPRLYGYSVKGKRCYGQHEWIATDINHYLDFVMALFIAFGVSFEIPVAIILLCWCGVTNPYDLKKKCLYVLVGVFIICMLLTPPDIFSQTLLAIPMYLLFEVGILSAHFYAKKPRTKQVSKP